MDVAEWTGVLPVVMDARTRTEIVSFQRDNGRGVDVEISSLVAGISGRHVEIMRGELASILYEATRRDVQYLFEDPTRSISPVDRSRRSAATPSPHPAVLVPTHIRGLCSPTPGHADCYLAGCSSCQGFGWAW
jgi:hypothetical protein